MTWRYYWPSRGFTLLVIEHCERNGPRVVGQIIRPRAPLLMRSVALAVCGELAVFEWRTIKDFQNE